MSHTIEAEIEPDGSVRLLEPLHIEKRTRARLTLLDETGAVSDENRHKRMAWMKANRERYGGQYVVLEIDRLIAVARTRREATQAARTANIKNAFITYLPKPDEIGEMGSW